MTWNPLIGLTLMVASSFTITPVVCAQTAYPERPVRLVVPFPAGGPTDVVARIYADRLSTQLGQAVVVENKAGASGALGSSEVARGQPDGYTLLFGTASTHGLYPLLAKKPTYHPLKDFAPIAIIGSAPAVFVAKLAIPGDLKAILEYARANPGTLTYGSPGAATFLQLAAERLKSAAGGLNINHVAYRGSGPAMNDLVGGHIDLLVDTLGTSIQQHEAGKVRILALAKDSRSPLAPEVATVAEALGLKSFEASLWNVVVAPVSTPGPVLQRLAEATQIIVEDEKFKVELSRFGIEPSPHTTPEAATTFIQGEIERWRPVVEAAGVSIQ